MEYTIFKDRLLKQLEEEIGVGNSIKVSQINGINQSEKEVIEICRNSVGFVQTFHLRPLYEHYSEDGDIHGTVRDIIQEYNKLEEFSIDPELLKNWNYVKPHIKRYVINRQWNRELLLSLIYDAYLDLAVVYYVELYHEDHGIFEIKISQDHIDLWKVSHKQLKQVAIENETHTFFLMKHISQVMLECINDICSGTDEIITPDNVLSKQPPLYVITNKNKYKCTSVILDADKLYKIATQFGSSYYIIPSSIHELILIPDYIEKPVELKNMLAEINATHVAADEVLSNNIYFFDTEEKQVSIVNT